MWQHRPRVSGYSTFALGTPPEPQRSPVELPAARPNLRRLQDAGPIVLFAAPTFVVLFWHLGTPTFWDPDEAHYAETTREMLLTGDWWAPFYNDEPFFDNPILFHQLQAVGMVVLGPTELAARLVPAAAALGLVLLTFWFGSRIGSRGVRLLAARPALARPRAVSRSRAAR